MKKILALVLVMLLSMSLFACGNSDTPPDDTTMLPAGDDTPVVQTPPDLTGEWEQTNQEADGNVHVATIQGETIEIYWVDSEDETQMLYWAGTFVAPTTAAEPYKWESVNDTERTDTALLASTAETKTFTYQDGKISYEASALDVTWIVELEKV